MTSVQSTRLESFKHNVARVRAHRDVLRSQLQSLEDEIAKLKYSAELNQKSSEVYKKWLEDLLKSNVDSISDLVTSGLQHTIRDQTLKFNIKQELKYNRLAMRFVIEEDGIEADPMSSFGGGAVLMASFILRLAVMTRLNMGNLLLLDESMSGLAARYIPNAASFMRQISEDTGINILMVTHNEEFLNHAHKSYEAYTIRDSNNIKSLKLRDQSVR
jgi:DNA repair exonuclease SbcCD ATPase subunit